METQKYFIGDLIEEMKTKINAHFNIDTKNSLYSTSEQNDEIKDQECEQKSLLDSNIRDQIKT